MERSPLKNCRQNGQYEVEEEQSFGDRRRDDKEKGKVNSSPTKRPVKEEGLKFGEAENKRITRKSRRKNRL